MTDRLISLKAAVEAAEAVTDAYAQDECGQAIVAAIKALPDAWPQSGQQADNDWLPFVPFHPKPKSEPPK